MSGIHTKNGKAFEYACLMALYNTLSTKQKVHIEHTQSYKTAQDYFNNISSALKGKLDKAANAAARAVIRLEPQLEYPNGNIPLCLSIQTDAKGMDGDVRDVLCIRAQNGWEIGLSCKHNHHAVKHPRLSSTIDFGEKWFGIPCTHSYFSSINPLFIELRQIKDHSKALWSTIKDKEERFYLPVLDAFMSELMKLNNANPGKIPERLIQYLIGKNDFYKVITDDNHQTTRVEGVNISGTLNRPSGAHNSIVNVARLKLPSQFYQIGIMNNSRTTVEVVCNEGWSVSMRIHNASSRVEPSLKFDVNLISLPSSIHAQVEPW
ncbi:MAG: HaeIII family restriction endonuclease [Oscillospiraceae bacterium]|nr:HaeIII family restriction endonuclease [Oscillospiraceae bacterium]